MTPEPDTTRQRQASGPDLWRGLEELADSPAFREQLEREFPEGASEWNDPVTRRHFLTLAGASLALAGAAGCSPRPAPQRKLVPYVRQPDELTPGIPLFFATAFPLGGVANGVLVRSNEGRPTKIEGNPDHPGSRGATDLYTQASILNLYDPDRSQLITREGTGSTWETAIVAIRSQFRERKGGDGLVILTETVTSPTLAAELEDLLKELPKARWVQYEPLGREAVHEGARRAFGRPLNVVYDFTKADVVLSLDSDFLSCGPGSVRYQHDFAERRRVRHNAENLERREKQVNGIPADQMSRLYVVESMLTNTGASADHRLPLRPAEVELFARALAAELKVPGAPPAGPVPEDYRAWIAPLARDLARKKGRSLVVVGAGQPASVHALVHAINGHLGNLGETVHLTAPLEARPGDHLADLGTLVKDMKAGSVGMIIIVGGNPVYNAPADLDFAAALDRVPFRVHLGEYQDETAGLCHWHIPLAHYLETWGDARGFDGTVTVMQPLIEPLYGARSAIEFFAALLERTEQAGREIVRSFWQRSWENQKRSGNFEASWQHWLKVGVVADSAFARENVSVRNDWAAGQTEPPAAAKSVLDIHFCQDPTLYDGRFANNGWLQELPKPVSKLTWDNAAIMSPKTAERYGVSAVPRWTAGERGRMEVNLVELNYKGRKVQAAAWIVPGHADDVVTVYLGHGRTRAGQVGNGTGFDAYALRTSDAPWFGQGVELTKTSDTYFLACTQAMYSMEGRKPVRRATLAGYRKEPEFAKKTPAASGESDLINDNVPGPGERAERRTTEPPHRTDDTGHQQWMDWGSSENAPPHKAHDHDHDHGHDHDHDHDHKGESGNGNGHHEHDRRLLPLTLYPDTNKNRENRRWGMVIDLSTCTGCSACIVACQSENNIPVVGKKEITRGHEMQWLRVDRYFTVAGPDEDHPRDLDYDKRPQGVLDAAAIQTYFQPVPCMHCEKAPCELVCPVAATVHSADGLNDMVYNRCVGTRYCSNNCPYKVRRFNFYTFQDFATESLKLMRNPEVTVRSRGVMEKCTYCVQRIRVAEVEAEREQRDIEDGEILTACQAACPSQAIIFGDIAKQDSAVRRWKGEPTNYGLLAELNTMPRTTYLASLRNPNPEMPKPKGA